MTGVTNQIFDIGYLVTVVASLEKLKGVFSHVPIENTIIWNGSRVANSSTEYISPFYVSLNIHDKIFHNFLLDFGAPHNLIPKSIMDELGLEITKSYHDLFSFDYRKIKCLGLIKDLVISLSYFPMRSMVMEIVVVDVPTKFVLILSKAWIKNLGRTLQMDISYSTVPMFGGDT